MSVVFGALTIYEIFTTLPFSNQSTGTSETWEAKGPDCGTLISIFLGGPIVRGANTKAGPTLGLRV